MSRLLTRHHKINHEEPDKAVQEDPLEVHGNSRQFTSFFPEWNAQVLVQVRLRGESCSLPLSLSLSQLTLSARAPHNKKGSRDCCSEICCSRPFSDMAVQHASVHACMVNGLKLTADITGKREQGRRFEREICSFCSRCLQDNEDETELTRAVAVMMIADSPHVMMICVYARACCCFCIQLTKRGRSMAASGPPGAVASLSTRVSSCIESLPPTHAVTWRATSALAACAMCAVCCVCVLE